MKPKHDWQIIAVFKQQQQRIHHNDPKQRRQPKP